MPADTGYAFICLLRDRDDATGLSRLLDDVKLPNAQAPATFLVPPVSGVDFFSDEQRQADIDEWWGENVPPDALPVYMINHEDGLADWLQGLDGLLYIGVPAPNTAALYAGGGENVTTFKATSPLDFATVVMRDFSRAAGQMVVLFDEAEALRMAALSADFPMNMDDGGFAEEPVPAPNQRPRRPAAGAATAPAPRAPAPAAARPRAAQPAGAHPFDLLSQPAPAAAPAGRPAPAPAPVSPFDHPGMQSPAARTAAPPVPAPPATFDGGGGGAFGGGFGSEDPDPFRKAPPAPPVDPFGTANGGPAARGGSAGAAPWMGEGDPFTDPRLDPMRTGGASPAGRPQTPHERYGIQPAPQNDKVARKGPKLSLPISLGWPRKGWKTSFVETPTRDLAKLMTDRGPTIVVMGSRKGGVGKTSYAAGVAIVAGTILDAVSHKAAIIDANIANPDAWGQLNLREGAATVREVVAALTANRDDVPDPVYATTPALACYPESREATEYSKTDIRRFADYLRRRYTFIVVDMSNRLPDPLAGPEAAAAAYWLEYADVLVLPTTSSKQDFNGVLDYLDVRDLPPTIVPYIVPSVKKNRDHPVTQQYLSVIRDRVHKIVEIPDEADSVRYAGMEGVPVEQVSATLRSAYRELTESIIRVSPRQQH